MKIRLLLLSAALVPAIGPNAADAHHYCVKVEAGPADVDVTLTPPPIGEVPTAEHVEEVATEVECYFVPGSTEHTCHWVIEPETPLAVVVCLGGA